MSSTAYHERFAATLREILPEGFEVSADAHIVTVDYGAARLVGFPPGGVDRRAAVTVDDAEVWLAVAVSSLRRQSYHYTPEAKDAASALFRALGV